MFQQSDDEDYLLSPGNGAFAPPELDPAVARAPAQAELLPVRSVHAQAPIPPPQSVQAPVPMTVPTAPPQPMTVMAPAAMPSVSADPNPDVTERAHMLGFGLIASSLGAVAGLRIGGVYGGVAGTLFAGSAVNLYRAALHAARKTPEGDREATISATYSLIAAGLGGYISLKTSDWRKGEPRDRSYAPPLIQNKSGRGGLKGFY